LLCHQGQLSYRGKIWKYGRPKSLNFNLRSPQVERDKRKANEAMESEAHVVEDEDKVEDN
jgi:hypothetical protein